MTTDATAHARELVLAASEPQLRPVIDHFLEFLDDEELAERETRDIIGAAESMMALCRIREKGQTHVELFTPTLREHGWTSRRTIVEICTEDAPFLVDSVTAAIARQGLTVHLLLHPVVSVHRDKAGRLVEIGAPGGQLESWIHLEVDRMPHEQQRIELKERLQKVLADVRAAVEDWPLLRRACLKVVTDLRTTVPSSVDPNTVIPTVEFLTWLADNHFTFLGYREHVLETDENGEEALQPLPHTGLGILRTSRSSPARLSPEAQLTARDPRLLTITKANSRATVHRDVYLDYIGVRTFDDEGRVVGEHRFLGMFTSSAYASSVMTLPIVSEKVHAVLQASGYASSSHSGKDLQQILEQYPRDELFQDTADHLFQVASEVSRIRERRRARIFLRTDEFGRFVSALVYLPRDRFNTSVRLRVESLLLDVFGAGQIDHATRVDESSLAQLHFVVRMPKGSSVPEVDEAKLQSLLEDAIRSWDEQLVDALHRSHDEEEAALLLGTYGSAFPESYKEAVTAEEAIRDIRLLETLNDGQEFAVHLYEPEVDAPDTRILTLISRNQYALTRVMPMLTNLGVDVCYERPYTLRLANGEVRRISDYGLVVKDSALWAEASWGVTFEKAFAASWTGVAESDELNALVLRAGLDWRRIVILRAMSMYLRQIGSAFSITYVEQALLANPSIAAALVRLFEVRLDPALHGDRALLSAEVSEVLRVDLDQVSSLEHDRILRTILGVIEAIERTNFFQRSSDGSMKPWVSMKLDCARIPFLPKPHPMAEIWVYSPEVEGVHLRFGKVARGGLRWSDRREDFRTEVLGLVKAQMVKNAVIVPDGSKGGFVAKQLPPASDRAAWLEAGTSAYRTFIRALLDLTDNRTSGGIDAPRDVVRHDGDDPYLVVAADKGTASFSDIANSISQEYGFWLDDAFASGGSEGYDHKAMGITARGAWESVKRHFRELGHDTQTQDFTVVGVGDMSGDVFGNGMMLSERISLVAAFDHRHVFVDPTPNAAVSFVERQRLFKLSRSSWDDYDRDLISSGGGVFPLSAKSIPVTAEMASVLGLAEGVTSMTPAELKRAVLLAPVDLLWNGGIGTYLKASSETNAEIGDRGNDAIRVNGTELRVRVVGEGGNLGMSQLGRIEAAKCGVRINTDAIDNSAGVGTSDREVNIKILLGALVREGRLTLEERNELLQSMTDEVAVQVLRDNYEQNVLLGNSRANAAIMLPVHSRLIEWLEERNELDRELEFLPNATEIRQRIEDGRGLTRPEFAVLVAYAKLALKADLAATNVADDPWFARTLAEYFPEPIRAAYGDALDSHPLRSEIIINSIVNSMVNRGGITFASRAIDETGASSEHIVRAYVAVREIFDLRGFVAAVEATDNVVSAAKQTELYLSFRQLLDRAARWFMQHRPEGVSIGEEIEAFSAPVAALAEQLGTLLQGDDLAVFSARAAALESVEVPADLAHRAAGLLASLTLLDIVEQSRLRGWNLKEVASVFFAMSARLRIDELLDRVAALPQDDRWGSMARAAMRDDLYAVLTALTASVITHTEAGHTQDGLARIDIWLTHGGPTAQRAVAETLAAARAEDGAGLATLSVALRRLRSLVW